MLFVVVLFALLYACPATAFGDTFVANCAPLTIQRSDPIISPGIASSHVHSIVGGNAFARNMSNIYAARNANATTCDKKLDNSNYWVPQLYHGLANGSFEMVPFAAAAIYYQNRACNFTTSSQYCNKSKVALAFPDGFRMLAGDSSRRTQNNSDVTNRAINMMCIRDSQNLPSVQYQGFPPVKCDTIRAEVYFPSCWDGVNLDSPNHKSHVAYPEVGDFDGGVCPQSHPIALFSIFYEFFFDTFYYNDTNRFVFANGDTTGYGFHGDFIMGWKNRTILQSAFETCIGPGDDQCPINTAGETAPNTNHKGPQTLLVPAPVDGNEDLGLLFNAIPALPGNNPVNFSAPSQTRAIKIKAANGHYWLSSNSSSNIVAVASEASATIFQVLPLGSYSTFRVLSTGQFITADQGGSLPLIANRPNAQGWESFALSQQADGNYTIIAQANQNLVQLTSSNLLVASGGSTITALSLFQFEWLYS